MDSTLDLPKIDTYLSIKNASGQIETMDYCDFKSRTTNQSCRYVITVEMLSTCRYTTTSHARELNLPNQEKNEKTHFLFFAPTINLLWETNARVILLEDIHKVTTPVRVLRWFQMIVVLLE